MEDTLRVINHFNYYNYGKEVLILVLMEDTLRVLISNNKNLNIKCLNPCFNGRYSQRDIISNFTNDTKGLNPCFNGRYSQRYF